RWLTWGVAPEWWARRSATDADRPSGAAASSWSRIPEIDRAGLCMSAGHAGGRAHARPPLDEASSRGGSAWNRGLGCRGGMRLGTRYTAFPNAGRSRTLVGISPCRQADGRRTGLADA